MTDNTAQSFGGVTVGDHVRLRDDADPRAYGRVRGVRFDDGVIDRLDGSGSSGEFIRVKGDVSGAGRGDGDWYWCAPDEPELVHAPAGEDATEAKPEPAADVPHGLAGLRKLSEDMRDDGGLELWNFLYSGTESTWGVDEHSTESYRDTLARLVGEAEAERKEPEARVAGPIEQALRDEWGKEDPKDVADCSLALVDSGLVVSRRDTTSYIDDMIYGLLDELGETYEVTTLVGKQLPEGCHWPTYADGTPVEIGDRYVSSSGDVRTVEYVSVAIGASALCAQDLDDDLYEPGECVERPAPADTWDQLREDATLPPASYCDRHDVNLDQGWEPSDAVKAMARDLIDRAERLAKGGE